MTLMLSSSSCGLPTYAYLYPPEVVESRNDPENILPRNLIFTNAYDNNSNSFSGYEIYYKIYDPLDSSTSGTEYRTDKAAIIDTTGSTLIENRGFNRLYTSNSYTSITHKGTRPSFPIESSLLEEDFDIRLNFVQGLPDGDSFRAETYESDLNFSETLFFYRYIRNPEGVYEAKFFDINDFDIGDDDMPNTIDSDSYTESNNNKGDYYLYITFYAYSYGRDIEDVAESVYSVPVYLGTLKFNSDLTNDWSL